MSKGGYLEESFKKYAADPIVLTERAMLEMTARVLERMEELGLNRKQLAERANLDPAQITRIMSTKHNVTIATLGKIAAALELSDLRELFAPPRISTCSAWDENEEEIADVGEPPAKYRTGNPPK